MKGYFYAPVDGVYEFMLAADDQSIMAMSKVPNNSNPANLVTLLKQISHTNNYYNSYFLGQP